MGAGRDLDLLDFTLSEDALRLLQVIDSTTDEAARLGAIAALAQSGTRDAGRTLIEVFSNSLWRETRIAVIRVLGPMRLQRTTEFLVDLATQRDDLGLASEAVLALGATGEPMAGEFLVSILQEGDHPLHREAVIALGHLPHFPCNAELEALWLRPEAQASATLRQHLLLVQSRRGDVRVWPRVKALLTTASPEANGILFNAALIAASMCGGREALDLLQGLDIRYRYFANQLRQLSTERLELRLARSVEDAISALLAAAPPTAPALGVSLALAQALQYLHEFPTKEAWEAYRVLAATPTCGIDVLVRSALFDAERRDDDLAFLATHWDELDWDAASHLVRQHAAMHKSFCEQLVKRLAPNQICALFMRLREPKSIAILAAMAQDDALSVENRIKAINALVAQAKMAPAVAPAIGERLLELLRAESNPDMKARLVRALGQIRHDGAPFLIALAAMLKEESVDRASIYAALAHIGTDEAARVALRRLSKLGTKPEAFAEIKQIFVFLTHLPQLPDGDDVPIAPKELHESLTLSILAILAKNGQPAYAPMIERALGAKEFKLRLFGAAAAKHTTSGRIQEGLLTLLNDQSPTLVGRALDSLCARADASGHRRLIAWAGDCGRSAAHALKVMRSLRPDPKNAPSLLREIDALLKKGEHAFAVHDVREAAVNLRDNLQMLAGTSTQRSTSSTPSHTLDADLSSFVLGYHSFSETVKTVLRNAELTYKHTDLFDDRVDKSTMIVEYVKSIDILLQERFGAAIFLDQQPQLLPKMQSRIVQLQLDDESASAAQIVKDLQCGLHFPVDAFPVHKLIGISRSIVSGKIVRDQYAVIDGLRSWGLLLLVFGRKFRYRQVELEPLLKVADPANGAVSELAAEMNALQDMRNQAAHRATMLQSVKLAEVRAFSFKVLNALAAVLG